MRAAIPDLALTTDLIVGFPGETEDDFRETLEAVEEVGFDGAFTFVFSPRSGTEAATHARPGAGGGQARADRAADRGRPARRRERNAERVGGVEEVLVEGPSRTDPALQPRPHAAQHDRQLHRHARRPASSSASRSPAPPRPRSRAARPSPRPHSGDPRPRLGRLPERPRPRRPADRGRRARPASARSIRADSVGLLLRDGWQALLDDGVTRIVDLRGQSRDRRAIRRAARDVEVVHVPVLDHFDEETWDEIRALSEAAPSHAAATELVYLRSWSSAAPSFVERGRGGRHGAGAGRRPLPRRQGPHRARRGDPAAAGRRSGRR